MCVGVGLASALYGVVIPSIDPRYSCYRMEVRPSEIHRWGVFALEEIPWRRKVIEYTGEKVSSREIQRRRCGRLIYIFKLNRHWCLDGAKGGSGAELINHSCDPNLYSTVLYGHVLYFSKRFIHPGEELTVDYNFEKAMARVRCKCGAPTCRGTINLLK